MTITAESRVEEIEDKPETAGLNQEKQLQARLRVAQKRIEELENEALQEQVSQVLASIEVKERAKRLASKVAHYLEQGDSVIYAIIGVCFILTALIALGYSFWHLALVITELSSIPNGEFLSFVAHSIIKLISDFLLVIIILEVMSTIIEYLRNQVTSLSPFLFIGIISATRGIVSIGAKRAVDSFSSPDPEFSSAMIELGVNAAVILTLGLTLRLLRTRNR